MTKPSFKTVSMLVMILTLAGIGLWQKLRVEHWKAEAASRDGLVGEVAHLQRENERWQGQWNAANQRSEEYMQELTRLRAENVALQSEREGGGLDNGRNSKQAREGKEEPMDRKFGPGTSVRVVHCVHWVHAMMAYAKEHEKQLPTSLREVVGYLEDGEGKTCQIAASREEYEIVFQGHLSDITMPNEIPVLREKQPMQAPSGIWTRAYGYAVGIARLKISKEASFQNPEEPNFRD